MPAEAYLPTRTEENVTFVSIVMKGMAENFRSQATSSSQFSINEKEESVERL